HPDERIFQPLTQGHIMAEDELNKNPRTDEIATAEKDLDIFAGYIRRLENPDPVILSEGNGKGVKLYDEVDRDPHAGSVLQTRYLAVVGKEWEVLPADDDAKSEEIADWVKNALSNTNFDQARQELLQAILYGFYPGEVIWGVSDGKWAPVKIRAKHPRRFSFTLDREPMLLTPANMIEGEPVPDRKFIIFSYGSSDNPYGKGLGQKLWWPVWFKKNGIKFWLVFLEKFGMPTVVGKYPSGTEKKQQEKLMDAIEALQHDTGVKIPDNMVLELLEASRAGNVTYESLCDYMDRQISKAVLGQTLTTEVKGEGSYAASQTHNEVREDIIKADADLLCECLNATLIRWMVDYNFANVTAYPKLWIRVKDDEGQKELAERDEIIIRKIGGINVPKRYLHEKYNIPEPEDGEDVIGPGPGNPSGAPIDPVKKEFAEANLESGSTEGPPSDTLDVLSGKTLKFADLGPYIEPVEKLLSEVDSLEEFRDRLIETYSDMDDRTMGALLQQAFTLADLTGRYDAQNR
ncbi:MAG: DUF935 family protein, partial [Planctomycetota bacterium]